jgi:hypothetical protein
MGADAEARAFGRPRLQFAVFERHQDAARCAHRFHRKIQDQLEQFVERHVPGELAAGTDQGLDVTATGDLLFGVQHAIQAFGHGGLLRGGGWFFDEHHGLRGRRASQREDHAQLACGDFIARPQDVRARDGCAIDESTVGAAEIAHDPIRPIALKDQMLA